MSISANRASQNLIAARIKQRRMILILLAYIVVVVGFTVLMAVARR